jgi:prepilin-type N-terminal cleavage/methylation domain-containing protein
VRIGVEPLFLSMNQFHNNYMGGIQRNSKGMSLIEVLIGIGIVSIIMMSTTTVFTNMNKESKALSEKLTLNDIKMRLQYAMINQNYCSCLVRGRTFNPSSKTFDPPFNSGPIPNTYEQPAPIDLNTPCIPAGNVAAGDVLVPAVGNKIATTSLEVKSIEATGIQDRGSGNYAGNLEVGFTNTVRSLRNVVVPFNFSIDPATGKFKSCSPAGSAGFKIIAQDVPAGNSVNVPANTCRTAIKVEMSMNAHRQDTPPGGYIGRTFQILQNGGAHPQLTLEFGSGKGGSSGHGWDYRANGLSKTYYTTQVTVDNDFTSSLSGDPRIDVSDAYYTVTCPD